MQLETGSLCRGLRWPYLSLLLTSVLSAAATDPKCSCRLYGSCVFAASYSNARNVAVGKTAKMSSEFHSVPYGETSGPACLVVNGKTDTTFRPVNKFPNSPNCIHTGEDDRDPYWEVDLGERYSIGSITVHWRSYLLKVRSDGAKITVDGQLCHTFRNPVSNPSDIVCSPQLAGQTVRLSKNDHTTVYNYFLTVCEVEVWVCRQGFFGTQCQNVCPKPVCSNNQVCSPFDGTCPNDPQCSCRLYGSCVFAAGPTAKKNVAVGKTAKMSSVFHSVRNNQTSGPACLAVNGKTDTTFRPLNQFRDSPNCIHTGDGDREPYWEVDLGQRYSINSITVYWRSYKLQERSDGVNITVDGQLCHTFRSPVSNPSHFVCVTQLAGQAVSLSKNDHTTSDDYFITVCAVEVWVCLPGFFGSECQHVCPVCKNNQVCSPVDGTCPEVCLPGFFGSECHMCPDPVCKNNETCSPFDGTCPDESYISDQTEVPSTPATVGAATSSSPATCDITKLVFPVVGAVLAGSVVIGICIAAIVWLRRSRDRRLGLTAEARGADCMVTEFGDVGRSEVRAQSSGLHDNKTQGDYVNLHDVSDVAVQGHEGNKYLAFPTRKSDKSGLSSDLSDDGEYEEMK